ncbi:hypothetical protein AB3S75_029251 [Citrus x aurantiifolia]
MASTQCYKPVEQTCYQGQYDEYDSSVAHKTHATQPSLVKTQTQCTTKTQAYYGETQTNNPSPNNGYGYGYGHPHSQSHGNYVEQTKAHGSTTAVCVDQSKVHGHGQGRAHSANSTGLNVTAATPSGCHGNGSKRRGVPRRRSLLQKLKDGLSGGDSSSSSSDSESDGEHSSRRSPNHC